MRFTAVSQGIAFITAEYALWKVEHPNSFLIAALEEVAHATSHVSIPNGSWGPLSLKPIGEHTDTRRIQFGINMDFATIHPSIGIIDSDNDATICRKHKAALRGLLSIPNPITTGDVEYLFICVSWRIEFVDTNDNKRLIYIFQ